MTAILVDVLLCVAVLCVWLACLGLVRLPTPLDRIHIIPFVTVTAGVALLLAAILSDGATPRTAKIAAILVLCLLGGAASSHALGRALYERGDR